ncbi:Retrovirus-related Pol polyprotein from transposon opus, partial [Mucuna pruriens]
MVPFSLINAPSTFMRLMNYVVRSFIGKFLVVYFDDILIYIKALDEHVEHLYVVLNILRENKLYGNLKSVHFALNLFSKGISADEVKVKDDMHGRDFNLLKDKLTNAPLLCLPNFDKAFKLNVMLLESKPIAYFSEKFSRTAFNYPTYDKELYALRHAKWLEIIEMFHYVIKYKNGKENTITNALSKRYVLLTSLQTKLLNFEIIKNLYVNDFDFGQKNKLYVPICSLHEMIVRETHGGGLMRHFGVKKILEILKEHFFA